MTFIISSSSRTRQYRSLGTWNCITNDRFRQLLLKFLGTCAQYVRLFLRQRLGPNVKPLGIQARTKGENTLLELTFFFGAVSEKSSNCSPQACFVRKT